MNRKYECDRMFNVVKSTMVGKTYYAAVRGGGGITAVVCVTKVRDGELFCKTFEENEEPIYYDCPDSILNLLSPTDNEYSIKWRTKCRERNEQRREIRRLPFGSRIIVDGEEYTKAKHGGKTYWLNNEYRYVRPQTIFELGYEVV